MLFNFKLLQLMVTLLAMVRNAFSSILVSISQTHRPLFIYLSYLLMVVPFIDTFILAECYCDDYACEIAQLFKGLLIIPLLFVFYVGCCYYLSRFYRVNLDWALQIVTTLFFLSYFLVLGRFVFLKNWLLGALQVDASLIWAFSQDSLWRLTLIAMEKVGTSTVSILTVKIPFVNQFFNFTFLIDSLGVLFIILTALLISLCVFFLVPLFGYEKNISLYLSQLVLLLTQLQITFTTDNLLIFFLAFESLLIPIIIIITLFGSPNRRQANNYLVFYTIVSAIPMLLAILYMQQTTGSCSLLALASYKWSLREQLFLWLALFMAFAVKTPIVPVHIWLPKAHVDAPTVGSVILAGLLLKVGLVGFIRFLLPIFPLATHYFAPYVSVLATIGVLYSSLITLRQVDIKRIIAYSSVAHINMAVVSLCSLNPIGLYSCIYLIISHGLIASGLFFLVGFLYNRFHIRTIFYFGGLATLIPVITIFFFFFSLANIAFPFTSGFIGELLLLLGITSTNFFLGFLNSISMLLTTAYTLLLFGRVFLGQLKNHFQILSFSDQVKNDNLTSHWFIIDWFTLKLSPYDLYYYELIILLILTILILVLGCYPQILFGFLFNCEVLQLIIQKVYFVDSLLNVIFFIFCL